jgi:hypothetical protein
MHACNCCFINRRWCRVKDGCGMRTRRLYFWFYPKPGLCLVHVAFKDIALLHCTQCIKSLNCANRLNITLNIGKATINTPSSGSLPRLLGYHPTSPYLCRTPPRTTEPTETFPPPQSIATSNGQYQATQHRIWALRSRAFGWGKMIKVFNWFPDKIIGGSPSVISGDFP